VFFRLNALEAGVKRGFLPLDSDKSTIIMYYEKGLRIPGQSSMVFVHGFSSNKESWLSLVEVSSYLLINIKQIFFLFIEYFKWLSLYPN
jgi:hypothetical protein